MLQLGLSRSSSNRVSPDKRNGGWLSRNMLLQRALAGCLQRISNTERSQIHRATCTCHSIQNNPHRSCASQRNVALKLCTIENKAHAQPEHLINTSTHIFAMLTRTHPCTLPLDGQTETANARHWMFSLYCICYFVSLYQLCV